MRYDAPRVPASHASGS